MEIIDNKKFVRVALDDNIKSFVLYVTFLLRIAINLTTKI